MSFLIVLAALAFLMLAAYRGYSVILFAPVAALGAVLTDPGGRQDDAVRPEGRPGIERHGIHAHDSIMEQVCLHNTATIDR